MAERRGSGTGNPSSLSPSARFLVFLTALPVTLATFAFFLQWRGGYSDPATVAKLWGLEDTGKFPGWQPHAEHQAAQASAEGCGTPTRTALFPHHLGWHTAEASDRGPKICITTTTSSSVEMILVWLFYHRTVGVSNFYLFVEGPAASANSTAILESIKGVKVIHRTKELEDKQAKSRIWGENWLSSFFWKPCNYELFVKQSLNMEMAIVMARDDGMDWIAHVDTDELLHPGGASEYSLKALFMTIEPNVDTVIFPNYESAVERDDVVLPFVEVSMFKKNYDHVTKEVYFGHYREATRGNPNYFLTYGNGKSAARIQDFLRPNGAHRWHNYAKTPVEYKFPEAAVLHYTYAKFSDLTSRRDRCGCKPTKDDVQKCFMLEFDRLAFIIASTASKEEMRKWYKEHVVWEDPELKQKLLKKSLFGRLYEPQIIVRGVMASQVIEQTIAAGMARTSAIETGEISAPVNPVTQIQHKQNLEGERAGEAAGRKEEDAEERVNLRGKRVTVGQNKLGSSLDKNKLGKGEGQLRGQGQSKLRRQLLSFLGLGIKERQFNQALTIPDAIPPLASQSPKGTAWRLF